MSPVIPLQGLVVEVMVDIHSLDADFNERFIYITFYFSFCLVADGYSLLLGVRSQRAFERPCLNDVTEVGLARKVTLGVSILLAVAALLPLWDDLAEYIGIGLGTTML